MPPGAGGGTSSLRREAQIHAQYPMLAVSSLRATWIPASRKLDEGQYDAIILAARPELPRLGFKRIRAPRRPSDVSLPAAGQGAPGHRGPGRPARSGRLMALLRRCPPGRLCALSGLLSQFRRAAAKRLGAQGVKCRTGTATARLVALPDGSRIARAERRGPIDQPEASGLVSGG